MTGGDLPTRPFAGSVSWSAPLDLTPPFATGGEAVGINDGGLVVGRYLTASNVDPTFDGRGFVVVLPQPQPDPPAPPTTVAPAPPPPVIVDPRFTG
jgi:hypothetical protein